VLLFHPDPNPPKPHTPQPSPLTPLATGSRSMNIEEWIGRQGHAMMLLRMLQLMCSGDKPEVCPAFFSFLTSPITVCATREQECAPCSHPQCHVTQNIAWSPRAVSGPAENRVPGVGCRVQGLSHAMILVRFLLLMCLGDKVEV